MPENKGDFSSLPGLLGESGTRPGRAAAGGAQSCLQVRPGAADAGTMPLGRARIRWSIRSLLLASLVGLWAGSALGYDQDASIHGNYRGQCRRLTKQIRYYEKTILPMAIERRNLAWEDATKAHIKRLWNKRADLCPKYGRERARLLVALDKIRQFNQMLARAGRAAAQYFSGGALP
jgi:hypothetical protein